MDNQGWVKLHRKIKDHEIMRDPTALQIFLWILVSVDYKTGTMVSGRFWASERLGIKPRTYHKALTERLQQKYNLVTLSSDNKKTTISVNKWAVYQSSGDSNGDSPVTTKGQQSDTTQELRIKKVSKDTTTHGSVEINEIISYMLEKFQLPQLDQSQRINRQYAQLLLKASKSGLVGVKWLVDMAADDDWWRNHITSTKDLYYNRVKIIANRRKNDNKFAGAI